MNNNVIPLFKEEEKPMLYVDHESGKITGRPKHTAEHKDFGDRVTKIKNSLEKINALMAELKKMREHDDV